MADPAETAEKAPAPLVLQERWQRGRRVGLALLGAGVILALAGVAIFQAPTCQGGSATTAAHCTPWENAQWLMIAGALLGALGFLYLAHLRLEKARESALSETMGSGASAQREAPR